jgi:ElaB/YqjD/DUF883 family membrane-anchored ribosome-binding protein
MADMQNPRRTANPVETGTTASASGTAEEWRDQIRDTGRDISQKAQELTTQGKDMAAEYYEQGREQVRAWQQQIEHQVREKPLQSLLLAAGIGLLIGLFKRR